MRTLAFTILSLFVISLAGCPAKPAVNPPKNGVAVADENEPTTSDTNETDGAPVPPSDSTEPTDGGEPAITGDAPAFVKDVLPMLNDDHIAAAGIHVQNAMASELFKSIPAEAKNELGGGDPLPGKILSGESGLVAAWALVGPVSEDKNIPPSMAFVFVGESEAKLKELFSFEEALAQGAMTEMKHGDVTYYQDPFGMSAAFVKGNMMFMAIGEEHFKNCITQINSTPDTQLVKQLASAEPDAQIVAAGFIEPVRDQLAEAIADNVQGPMAMLAGLPKQINSASLSINLDGDTPIKGDIEAIDAETADQLKGMVEGLVALGAGYLNSMEEEVEQAPNPALMKEAISAGNEALKAIKPTVDGAKVNLVMTRPASLDRLPEIIEKLRTEARKVNYYNNGKQLGLAAWNHRDTHNKFPEYGKRYDGEEVHSWRVKLLPYLEMENVYDSLDLKQAWDSDANKPFHDTHFDGFASESADGRLTTWKWVTDHPANIMIIDAGKGKEVPWMQPEEFKIDLNDPLSSLGEEPTGGYIVVYLDGSADQLTGEELVAKLKEAKEQE